MQHLVKRQKDPEYLKTLIGHKQIIIQESEKNIKRLNLELAEANKKIQQFSQKNNSLEATYSKQILNLKMGLDQYRYQNQTLRKENSQLEFNKNLLEVNQQQINKQHVKQIQYLKKEFQYQKQTLQNKIRKLQKDLFMFNKEHNLTQQNLHKDKIRIVEDANRDMRGVAGEKQARIVIIQNHRLNNQVEQQSRNIILLLKKNQKSQEQVKHYKSELEIHKEMEKELIKRSSLAQSLIKQLNNKIKELQNGNKQKNVSQWNQTQHYRSSQSSSRVSEINEQLKTLRDQTNKLKLQLSKQENYNRYLQNKQKNNNQKYQTLALILANYLELLFYDREQRREPMMEGAGQVAIDIQRLKNTDIKEWKPQELQTIITLLMIQIKPFLSKKSLTTFPQIKNVNVSFMEEVNKQPISLPKIAQDFENNFDQEIKKLTRFKDIPIDISTKILRSNLRQWGKKVTYGNPTNRFKQKSKSIHQEILDKSAI